METSEDKALFELSCSELERALSEMFMPLRVNHPIRCQVAAALMAAEATTQRLALDAFKHVNDEEGPNQFDHEELGELFETVETINQYMLEGEPHRIDLVLWDAEGYIRGWFADQHGQVDMRFGSCPQVVAKLSEALHVLAQQETDWRPALERYSADLASLLQLSREKAEIQAKAKVESQSWLKKLFSPTSVERELLSLGF